MNPLISKNYQIKLIFCNNFRESLNIGSTAEYNYIRSWNVPQTYALRWKILEQIRDKESYSNQRLNWTLDTHITQINYWKRKNLSFSNHTSCSLTRIKRESHRFNHTFNYSEWAKTIYFLHEGDIDTIGGVFSYFPFRLIRNYFWHTTKSLSNLATNIISSSGVEMAVQ